MKLTIVLVLEISIECLGIRLGIEIIRLSSINIISYQSFLFTFLDNFEIPYKETFFEFIEISLEFFSIFWNSFRNGENFASLTFGGRKNQGIIFQISEHCFSLPNVGQSSLFVIREFLGFFNEQFLFRSI